MQCAPARTGYIIPPGDSSKRENRFDEMRSIRIAIFGSSPCGSCYAACCKQNGHAFAVLLQGEMERRRFAPWAIDVQIMPDDLPESRVAPVTERVIAYRDGTCPFLGDDDLCTIYEDRPLACRQFECISGYHYADGDMTGHSRFLQLNDAVLQLLNRL